MTLTHTFTQTHRHYVDEQNLVTVDEARTKKFPLLAECGVVWIPGLVRESKALPMCPRCQSGRGRNRRKPADTPHYVYRIYDGEGRLIYVGCTVNPLARMEQHRKSSWWFDQMATTRLLVFPTRSYALERESEAIATENPRWNKRGRWPGRLAWSAADYQDYYTALMSSGSAQAQHIAKVLNEARRRFGVELEGVA